LFKIFWSAVHITFYEVLNKLYPDRLLLTLVVRTWNYSMNIKFCFVRSTIKRALNLDVQILKSGPDLIYFDMVNLCEAN
jgi:hypothetical protein